ncbi:granulocyte-macrophage colony-stimulating factor receptor subunit alpha-like isoform X2 [Mastacembelus armatus]|uniref:granulocyte-macrophage colony-stimulating factor receptor subunit alpha-like isoform X2 n=1 Tax=Mastacembelus armatus TaxID=205130 RepID=UPI000E462F2D|nr:granulocyte-macrophage colony-stimulating factor receptor subunit alpha-like isoform X2 [Mastacembelus armatus]XP_026170081.1 granulocyte-macrophage colony-stimulating factor receptor subunit alpha-like isoform X2 [Mastacembelus armatus]XP_026170082.1 granulocyte-macrophage colony-stimulating factor receptor subunit alpha-like isoform X2 [Mastacembelus armatus]
MNSTAPGRSTRYRWMNSFVSVSGLPPYCFNAENTGSRILPYPESTESEVEIRFKRSLRNNWTVYSCTYNTELLEVLAPPSNLSVLVDDGHLLVTWGLPQSRKNSAPQCFKYELDLGDQGGVKNLSQYLFYTELNIDPTYIYKVRIRTKRIDNCFESPMWSEWSPIVTVEQPVSKPNVVMITLISFGIPMILLTVLLVVRHLRVSELLFPPIPHPPRKYIHFLEKSDVFNFFQPALSAKVEEEITQVQDTE